MMNFLGPKLLGVRVSVDTPEILTSMDYHSRRVSGLGASMLLLYGGCRRQLTRSLMRKMEQLLEYEPLQ